ncbi:glycosyltransferase family 64 protein [Atractiella rhizophila]|nr:glycosyltransferase family 64 protein [Atractiella rhizophila]
MVRKSDDEKTIPLLTVTRSSSEFDQGETELLEDVEAWGSEDYSDFEGSEEWSFKRRVSSSSSNSSGFWSTPGSPLLVTRALRGVSKRRKKSFLRRLFLPLLLTLLILLPPAYLVALLLHTPYIPSTPSLPLLRRAYSAALSDSPADDDSFSLLIPTFRRPSLLLHNLELYANGSIPSLKDIFIIWGSPQAQDAPPDFSALAIEKGWKVKIEVVMGPPQRSLSSRFLPPPTLNTSIVLSLDDDLTLEPSEVESGFQTFKNASLVGSASLLGWSQRSHSVSPITGRWNYLSPLLSWLTGRYSIILTNQGFLRTALLTTYNHPLLSPLRDYVDLHTNCEDILMSMLSSSISEPPILLGYDGTITHWRKAGGTGGGISEGSGHYEQRVKCLERFAGFFGTRALEFRSRTIRDGEWVSGVKAPRIDQGRVWEEGVGEV